MKLCVTFEARNYFHGNIDAYHLSVFSCSFQNTASTSSRVVCCYSAMIQATQTSSNSYLQQPKSAMDLWLRSCYQVRTNERCFQLNSLVPCDIIWDHWTGPSLIQLQVCRPHGTNPLPETMPTFCRLTPHEQTSVKLTRNTKYCFWKCHLQNIGHIV